MKTQSGNMIYRNYSSNRSSFVKKRAKKTRKTKLITFSKIFGTVLLVAIIFTVPAYAYFHNGDRLVTIKNVPKVTPKATITPKVTTTPAVAVAPTSACTGNTLDQLILVSISQKHLWACQAGNIQYQTAVVTGDMNVAADVTPVGTYHIYGKHVNLYLNGSDSRGSWHDYVNYWMPFLSNRYGTFGLHDATWRAPTDFGTISPYSDNSSHGCVELPLDAAQWLFNWSSIGTTVTIES